MEENWKEYKSNCRSFLSPYEDEAIHIIKTGFDNEYFVIHNDAHEINHGSIKSMFKDEIEKEFNIEL